MGTNDIEKYITHSDKIEMGDLDWNEAKTTGLTEEERFVLTYFSDIESQTIRYLGTLLKMTIALRPNVTAFLITWAYEEFHHGQALANLLGECGYPLGEDRVETIKGRAKFNEWIERLFGPILSRIFSNQFPSVYLVFGAIQEMTTLRGYERLREATKNPVLKTLCERIARQERRHFAWYFNNAKEQLQISSSNRLLARKVVEFNWRPVGAGVKSNSEVNRLFSILFPAEFGKQLVREIDAKIGTLPGFEGIRLMQDYFKAHS